MQVIESNIIAWWNDIFTVSFQGCNLANRPKADQVGHKEKNTYFIIMQVIYYTTYQTRCTIYVSIRLQIAFIDVHQLYW